MKLSTTFFHISLLVFLLLSSCSDASSTDEAAQPNNTTQQAANVSFKSIAPQEAKQLIDSKKDLLLLDVRTPQEIKSEGAIPGSRVVPLWAIFKNQIALPKDQPIMLICAVGGRSYAAGQMLKKYGHKEIYNLGGGISAWKKAGLPVQ